MQISPGFAYEKTVSGLWSVSKTNVAKKVVSVVENIQQNLPAIKVEKYSNS